MPPTKQNIGRLIRHHRERLGLTQLELAERLHLLGLLYVDQRYVSKRERGEHGCTVADCLTLAIALEASPVDFLAADRADPAGPIRVANAADGGVEITPDQLQEWLQVDGPPPRWLAGSIEWLQNWKPPNGQ